MGSRQPRGIPPELTRDEDTSVLDMPAKPGCSMVGLAFRGRRALAGFQQNLRSYMCPRQLVQLEGSCSKKKKNPLLPPSLSPMYANYFFYPLHYSNPSSPTVPLGSQ